MIVLRLDTDGTLDTGFGDAGVTIVPPGAGGDTPVDMVVLPDDRILVGGNNAAGPFVMRFLPNGAPDPTIGASGVKSLFLGNQGVIQSITATSAGRILVGGHREDQPVKGFVAKVWN